MNVYRVEIEPCTDRRDGHMMNFRASCPSVPGAASLGVDEGHAVAGLPAMLGDALVALYRAGRAMPPPDHVEPGQLSAPAPFYWSAPAVRAVAS